MKGKCLNLVYKNLEEHKISEHFLELKSQVNKLFEKDKKSFFAIKKHHKMI